MEIGNQILFFLAGLGVFNTLLLAVYILFFLKPKRWVNILFGLLMLMLCIRVGKSLFHVFTDLDRIYLQIGLSACIMIGPLLYIYIKSALSRVNIPKQSGWFHLLIPLITVLSIGIAWPYERYPDFWNKRVVISIYGIWCIYMIAASVLVIPLVKKLWVKRISILEQWLLLVHLCVLLLCVTYVMAYYGYGLPYVASPILFSIVFYVLTSYLLSKKNRSVILYQEVAKYQKQKVSKKKAEDLLKRLMNAMEQQQFYLDPKIKLAELADVIQSTPHEVSQVVNDRLGVSFNHYINEYRVKAACKMLRNSDHLTVEGIGREAGFNSKSAFYATFKAIMKQSPAQYKSQLRAKSK